jgi:hypothetical protein
VSVEISVNQDVKFATLASLLSAIQKSEGARVDLTVRVQKAEGISARIQVPPDFPYRDLVGLLDVLKNAGAHTMKLQVGTEDQPATPDGESPALEKKVAQLERELAVVRAELETLRRQLPPAREANPEESAIPVAWGKAVNGLQAGLRYPASQSSIALGEAAPFEVVVRNVGDRSIKVPHVGPSAFLAAVEEDRQLLLRPVGIGDGFEVTRVLAPGEEMVFGISLLLLPPRQTVSPGRPWVEITPGKYRVSCPSVLLRRDGSDDKLATGLLQLEVLPPREKEE